MGYVHDTQMTRFLHPEEAQFSAGTWSDGAAANVWSKNRSAADATFVIKIPVKLPGNGAGLKGARLRAIEVLWSNATANLDALAAAVYKATLPATGDAFGAPAALSFGYDSGHAAAAGRITQDEHRMVLTLDAPVWLGEADEVYVELAVDAAATSVFKYFGALARYSLRV